jgi:hypothetical protein
MSNILKSIIFSLAVLSTGCVNQKQNKGLITPISTESTVDFITARNVVVIPLKLNGESKNFILDSGDEMTTISRKELVGRISKVGTATGEKTKVGNEVVKSIKVGDMEFQNICAQNLDLSIVGNEVPNYGGLIGQAVLSKANWLIDYPKKKLTVSTKALNTDGFETIAMKNIRNPFLNFEYEGVTYKGFIDLGSSTAFSVIQTSKLGQILLKKYNFVDESKTTTTAGGTATTIVKRGTVSNIKIGGVEFNNLSTVSAKTSSHEIRIGMSFFKDHVLYLDYTNGVYRIK